MHFLVETPESAALPVAPAFPHPIPEFLGQPGDENDEGVQPENHEMPDKISMDPMHLMHVVTSIAYPNNQPIQQLHIRPIQPSDEQNEGFQPENDWNPDTGSNGGIGGK